MARDHPHHALPIILALANANKDAIITSTKKTGRLARTSSVKDSDTSHADEVSQMFNLLSRCKCDVFPSSNVYNRSEEFQDSYWPISQV